MNTNKDMLDNNSNLEDGSTSIHLDNEFFISSPKIGTVKISSIVKSKSQIFTPNFPKNLFSTTVFISCENSSFHQKQNNIKLEKNNNNGKNICGSSGNLIKEINDNDNNNSRNTKKLKNKKLKKDKDKKSFTEQKKKNNKPKTISIKEVKKPIKLNYYKSDGTNIFNPINDDKIEKVNKKSAKNNPKTKTLLKSSSLIPSFIENCKQEKKGSAKFYNHQQIDEKKPLKRRKTYFANYKKENEVILKLLKKNGNKKTKKDLTEKIDNKVTSSKKTINNFFQFKKQQSMVEFNYNNNESSDSLEKIDLRKSRRRLFSIGIKKYKNSNQKNKNLLKSNKQNNNKSTKNKTVDDETNLITKNNSVNLKKTFKESLSTKFARNTKVRNTFIPKRSSINNFMSSFAIKEAINELENKDKIKKKNTIIKISEEDIDSYSNKENIENFYEYLATCLETIIELDIKSQPRCKSEINFNFPKNMQNKKIALFDLDETLIHCVGEIKKDVIPELKCDHKILVNLPIGRKALIGINERPLWKESLDRIKDDYNIVIYTASHNTYADAILNYLDKENKYFNYRLYRNNCVQCVSNDGMKFYVKDLDIFKKYYDLKNILIIDNSVLSFAFHLNNGIPVIPYYDSKEDKELKLVALYLLSIADCDDVRIENKKHFQLEKHLEIAKKNIENINESFSKKSDNENESEKKDSKNIIKNIEKPNENNFAIHKYKTIKSSMDNRLTSKIIPKHQLNVSDKNQNFTRRNSCILKINKKILNKNKFDLCQISENIRSNKKYGTGKNKMDYANMFKSICFKYAAKKSTSKIII